MGIQGQLQVLHLIQLKRPWWWDVVVVILNFGIYNTDTVIHCFDLRRSCEILFDTFNETE